MEKGTTALAVGRVCAAHRLPIASELDLCSSDLRTPKYLKLRQLSQHIINVVPQPAHKSQSVARSVKQAMGASSRATGWACKAPGQVAHLERLRSASGGVHRRGRQGSFQFIRERVKGRYKLWGACSALQAFYYKHLLCNKACSLTSAPTAALLRRAG